MRMARGSQIVLRVLCDAIEESYRQIRTVRHRYRDAAAEDKVVFDWRFPNSIATAGRGFLEENLTGSFETRGTRGGGC